MKLGFPASSPASSALVTLLLLPTFLFGIVESNCFNLTTDEFVEDCTCHESCLECGPYEVADDCLSCFDGYTLTVIYEDGTGDCALDDLEPVPCHETCFECGTYGTDDDCFSCVDGFTLNVTYADGSGTCISEVVEPVLCHETCFECGTYGTDDDCFSCVDGLTLNVMYPDGSGTCISEVVNPPDTVVDPADTVVDPPDTVPDTSGGGGGGGICFMMYMLADTDSIEGGLRDDFTEITNSQFVRNPSLTTWIYFDGRNLGLGPDEDIPEPLDGAFNADGSPVTVKYEGSRYFTWDHDTEKMLIDTTLEGEQNSDDPAVLTTYLIHALSDCVAKGKSEYMLTLSSHGSGYQGFGGDNHARRLGGVQSNASIVGAIRSALAAVTGAPDRLNVLGFDACLMQAAGAADDYKGITDYYLASEAVEPGHGWAFNELTETGSSLDLAVDIVKTFASSTQGYPYHFPPKTLAVIDTSKYDAFLSSWEALSAEMTAILEAKNDPDFVATLARARASTVSFEGPFDLPGQKNVVAAMDIGNFFQTLLAMCNPDPSSQLFLLVNQAMNDYSAMFVEFQKGPNTPGGTGMHISWPVKQEYIDYPDYYESTLFSTTDPFLNNAPNYYSFLRAYYAATTPSEGDGSVCQVSVEPSRKASNENELLIDPDIYFPDFNVEFRSEITRNVDFVFVEYGYDLTHLLESRRALRRASSVFKAKAETRRRRRVNDQGEEVTSTELNRIGLKKRSQRVQPRHRRRTQEDNEDYFYIFGGDINAEYDGPRVTSTWDRNYYWIEYSDNFEPVYVFDDGGGLKSIPVCYFPPSSPVTAEDVDSVSTEEEAIDSLGCRSAYLQFSIVDAGVEIDNVELFVYNDAGTLSDLPRARGGQIVHITYVDVSIDGEFFTELLGGFNTTIIPWQADTDVSISPVADSDLYDAFETNVGYIDASAYDTDTDIADFRIFAYEVDLESETGGTETTGPDGGSGENGDRGESEATSGGPSTGCWSIFSTWVLVIVVAIYL